MLLLLAVAPLLAPGQRGELEGVLAGIAADSALGRELGNVRSQLLALWSYAERPAQSASATH